MSILARSRPATVTRAGAASCRSVRTAAVEGPGVAPQRVILLAVLPISHHGPELTRRGSGRSAAPEPRARTRSAGAWSRTDDTGGCPMGLPDFVPFVLARSIPACTRSMSLARSCSAPHPKIAMRSGRTGPGRVEPRLSNGEHHYFADAVAFQHVLNRPDHRAWSRSSARRSRERDRCARPPSSGRTRAAPSKRTPLPRGQPARRRAPVQAGEVRRADFPSLPLGRHANLEGRSVHTTMD
jgi:hypothetical protein